MLSVRWGTSIRLNFIQRFQLLLLKTHHGILYNISPRKNAVCHYPYFASGIRGWWCRRNFGDGSNQTKKNLTTVKRSGHPAAAAARIRRWTFSFFNRGIRLAGPSFFSPMLTTFQSLSSPPTLSFSLIKWLDQEWLNDAKTDWLFTSIT